MEGNKGHTPLSIANIYRKTNMLLIKNEKKNTICIVLLKPKIF